MLTTDYSKKVMENAVKGIQIVKLKTTDIKKNIIFRSEQEKFHVLYFEKEKSE